MQTKIYVKNWKDIGCLFFFMADQRVWSDATKSERRGRFQLFLKSLFLKVKEGSRCKTLHYWNSLTNNIKTWKSENVGGCNFIFNYSDVEILFFFNVF